MANATDAKQRERRKKTMCGGCIVDVYWSVFDMWSCLEWSAVYIHNSNRKYRYLYIKCNTQRSKQKYPSSKGEGIEWKETKQEKSDTVNNKELRKETHTQHPQYRTNLTPFAALCEKCLTIVIGSAFGNKFALFSSLGSFGSFLFLAVRCIACWLSLWLAIVNRLIAIHEPIQPSTQNKWNCSFRFGRCWSVLCCFVSTLRTLSRSKNDCEATLDVASK